MAQAGRASQEVGDFHWTGISSLGHLYGQACRVRPLSTNISKMAEIFYSIVLIIIEITTGKYDYAILSRQFMLGILSTAMPVHITVSGKMLPAGA